MDDEVRKNWDRVRVRGSDDPYVISARRRLDAAVDLPTRFPDLGARPYVLDRYAVDDLLSRLGSAFEVVDLDAGQARDQHDLLAMLAARLDLPSTAAANWDAFFDGFASVAERDVAPLAIVLRGLDNMLRISAREFMVAFYELERTVYAISAYRPVVPRQVVAIYLGSWSEDR